MKIENQSQLCIEVLNKGKETIQSAICTKKGKEEEDIDLMRTLLFQIEIPLTSLL